MSKLNLDMAGFKKIGGDAKHTLMKHATDGHELKLDHSKLDPKVVKALAKLPTFCADGADLVDDLGTFTGDAPKAPIISQDARDALADSVEQPQVAPVSATQPEPIGSPIKADDPFGMQTEAALATKGYTGTRGGMQAAGAATAQGEADRAQIEGDQAVDEGMRNQQYTNTLTHLRSEHASLQADLANNLIDPNEYMSNHSGVATAIGLLLGGAGGGRGTNPALAFLDKQIDRDIAAQQANQGTRKTLLDANLQQFGNERDAMMATKANYANIYSHLINQAAAQSGSATAKANAQIAVGQLDGGAAKMFQQIAMNKTLYGGVGTQGGQMPAELDPGLDRRVMVGNTALHAPNKETADKIRPQFSALDDIESAANEIDKFNATNGMVLNPLTTAAGTAAGLNRRMQAAIARAEAAGGGIGRLVNQFTDMAPSAGAIAQSRDAGRGRALRQFILDQRRELIKNNLTSGFALPKQGK